MVIADERKIIADSDVVAAVSAVRTQQPSRARARRSVSTRPPGVAAGHHERGYGHGVLNPVGGLVVRGFLAKPLTTNYQLPTTNYQLPTTNYQLPTTHQPPTTNHQPPNHQPPPPTTVLSDSDYRTVVEQAPLMIWAGERRREV